MDARLSRDFEIIRDLAKAAEAEAKIHPALFLCVNIPKSALFRSVQECGKFFDEEAAMVPEGWT